MARPQGTRITPGQEKADALFQQAAALHQRGDVAAASRLYDAALRLAPDHVDALQLRGVAALQLGQPRDAVTFLRKAVRLDRTAAAVHNNLGTALFEIDRADAALQSYDAAIALQPGFAEAHLNRGNTLIALGQPEAALRSFDQAIQLRPDYAKAHSARGHALVALGRAEDALASIDQALALRPDYAEAHCNRGNAQHELRRFEEAIASYDQALALRPDYAEAHYNRGNALLGAGRHAAAVQSLERAVALKPDYVKAHVALAQAFIGQQRYAKALASAEAALAIRPDDAAAQMLRGDALLELRQPEAALAGYLRAQAARRDDPALQGSIIAARMHMCDWSQRERDVQAATGLLDARQDGLDPLWVLALLPDRAAQLKAAAIRSAAIEAAIEPRLPAPARIAAAGERRRRIGYFSADFREHPVAYLTVGLFEAHDRDRFEVTAFSFGLQATTPFAARLRDAFDDVIDVTGMPDRAVAALAREQGLDIAVDLAGYTRGARPGILAHRAAPVQASYIGYLGSMGAGFMDYLIADAVTVPEDHAGDYAEKIVRLPHYQANDTTRPVAATTPARSELGLPERGFVFCCLNNSYKVTPAVFASWMRILARTGDSVLWLLADNPKVRETLRAEARRHGIAPERLVFTDRVPRPDYMARLRLADLFLDTSPYNAGTTASDALWAGLPVLTWLGETFAGRVAASVLHAAGLPELVTADAAAYEALAVELATRPDRIAALRARLAEGRTSCRLFDTAAFTRSLEAAYLAMLERSDAGLPPEDIRITA